MMHTTTTSYRPNDFLLQNSTHWTHRLPSTAIMGLLTIIGLLILILILDALRNHMSLHMKCDCFPTKKKKKRQNQEKDREIKDKEEKQESGQKRIISKTEESDNFRNITGLTIWNEDKEPPEYESITDNTEEDRLLTIKEKTHQTEQEINDLQGTVKSLQKEITTHYPLMQN